MIERVTKFLEVSWSFLIDSATGLVEGNIYTENPWVFPIRRVGVSCKLSLKLQWFRIGWVILRWWPGAPKHLGPAGRGHDVEWWLLVLILGRRWCLENGGALNLGNSWWFYVSACFCFSSYFLAAWLFCLSTSSKFRFSAFLTDCKALKQHQTWTSTK